MATEIIARMTLPPFEGVFHIGCNASRVTVLSQQIRALNLAWALAELGQVRKGSRVAIIGAGAAGLTSALALGRLDCTVRVFEREEKILSRFRGNTQRFLHPHVFDWPYESTQREQGGLPIMNWQASTAHGVVEQLERAWTIERLSSGDIEVLLSVSTKIDPLSHQVSWSGRDEGVEDFDIIIFAVGVGTERRSGGTPRYWENDSLGQIIHGGPRSILISGAGDGGLVDVARSTIHDFDHARVINRFLSNSFVHALTDPVLKIERRMALEKVDLDYEYSQLDLSYVSKIISEPIRTDREVTLYVNSEHIFDARTMILNRVLLESLRRKGAVTIWQGTQGIDPTRDGNGKFMVNADGETRVFDLVVLRHGPKSDLARDFADLSVGLPKKLADPDPTRVISWPDKFFDVRPKPASSSAVPRRYGVVEIDAGFGLESRAWSMNESGSVVGWSYVPSYQEHAFFVWHGKGLPPELGHVPGMGKMSATDINSQGDFLVSADGGNGQAWLVSKTGVTVLNESGRKAMGYSVNDNQVVAGWCESTEKGSVPCLWENGNVVLLKDLGKGGVALQLNNDRTIVGEVRIDSSGHLAGARWRNGNFEYFEPPAEYYSARCFRVNSDGVAAGYLMKSGSPSDFFIWPVEEKPRIIAQGEAYGINDAGWVTGRSGEKGAFLYDGQKMIWFEDLVDDSWWIHWPFALLNDFRVAGVARKDGIDRAVVLVPEF